MKPISSESILTFLNRLGARYTGQCAIYLLGGVALSLMGNPRVTQDLDYAVELAEGAEKDFQAAIARLAHGMQIDVEEVCLGEFIPLPPGAWERRQPIGRFGQIEVYLFDPYSIALSKITCGFESDLEDAVFLLGEGLIDFAELEDHFEAVLPDALEADIDPQEFRGYFEEVRRRVESR